MLNNNNTVRYSRVVNFAPALKSTRKVYASVISTYILRRRSSQSAKDIFSVLLSPAYLTFTLPPPSIEIPHICALYVCPSKSMRTVLPTLGTEMGTERGTLGSILLWLPRNDLRFRFAYFLYRATRRSDRRLLLFFLTSAFTSSIEYASPLLFANW